ncbi:MAG: dihydrolipoyl dehydrogenase [Bacteroidetes bacterium]|nr:dihydrolipoyl dehydrogenase [Bacteroidota bacterium]
MKYDVTVIGAGPGGYVAAIRCAQLGMKTALVEKYDSLGGTCLNVGCIPSKALLDSSEHYFAAKENFSNHGINLNDLSVDMPKMIQRKNEVVSQTVKGIEFLMKKNKIDVFHGHASFFEINKMKVLKKDGENLVLESDKFIIATGSKPIVPDAFNYDKKRVITSTEALGIQEVPKKMVVIGGGVIGLELGSVYARLGTKVDVIEFMDTLVPSMDTECVKELQKSMQKMGVTFHLNAQVTRVEPKGKSVDVYYKFKNTEEEIKQQADYCLVSIGRKPYTEKLGLENIGIKMDEKGKILVNNHLQTSIPTIFAIGDVVQGPMLAHKAEEEGVFVAEFMAGQKPHINYNLIPNVIYTWPEVAGVGQTEVQLKAAGIPFKVGKFPFKALGRARASMDMEGLVKILCHAQTDEILGMHITGARAADLIAEGVTLMEFRASAEDVCRMSHAHPTYAEAIKEAALAATANRAIHI